ncbi:MAG: dihydrofolate reductase [Betaproteobacteria bacterium]
MINHLQRQKPRISIIVAMARNRVIGINNALPWHLSADLKRFKALTMGHHIIMGRKTFESIGRILPGRTSVVVTRNPDFQQEGAIVVSDVDSALEKCAGDTEAFVIGGEAIFRAVLPLADRIHVTEIEKYFDGDTFFPELVSAAWREVSRESRIDADSKLAYSFVTLERNR